MENERALRLLIEDQQLWNNYIKDYGTFVLCQFTNTCVPDSLLAALHTAYIKYADIEDLLDRNAFFGKIMSLLNKKKYQEARQHFLQELNPGKVDLHSHVKDYFPLIAKLTWIKFTYEQKNPIMCAIYKEIPSVLKKCGDVILLGDPYSPTLILVHREVYNAVYQDCISTELPPLVFDEKKRKFVLQFLLLGKERHMTMCFQSYENNWHLYDNDPKQPSFQPFALESHENYAICLAGYVNKHQDQECKLGIAETGETAEAKPFDLGASSSIHSDPKYWMKDVEVEDLSSCRIAIPETGEGLGPKPFYQNWPEFLPKFSNQEQQVEDIEMASCSSTDSD